MRHRTAILRRTGRHAAVRDLLETTLDVLGLTAEVGECYLVFDAPTHIEAEIDGRWVSLKRGRTLFVVGLKAHVLGGSP